MRINFTARHSKAPTKLKEYAEKEAQRLGKFYDGIVDCEIILDHEKTFQIAEIKLTVYGNQLNVKEKSSDVYKAIDAAVDKLERQLKRYKDKLHRRSHDKVSTSLEK